MRRYTFGRSALEIWKIGDANEARIYSYPKKRNRRVRPKKGWMGCVKDDIMCKREVSAKIKMTATTYLEINGTCYIKPTPNNGKEQDNHEQSSMSGSKK